MLQISPSQVPNGKRKPKVTHLEGDTACQHSFENVVEINGPTLNGSNNTFLEVGANAGCGVFGASTIHEYKS
jgi:hypothetical protein